MCYEYKWRAFCARFMILIPMLMLGVMIFQTRPAAAVEAASINNSYLFTDGLCLAGNQSSFMIEYSVDPDTNDVINSDTHTLYLLDGNNIVLDSRNLDVFRWNSGPSNYSTLLFTKVNPTKGPFKILIHDNASLSADFANGSTFSAPLSKISTQVSLDAHGADTDCPGVVTVNNDDEDSEETSENSQTVESQQEQVTTEIINQQTHNFIDGVSENVGSLFRGDGTDPVFAPTHFTSNSTQFSGNFSIQSTGLKRWLRQKRLELDRQKAARLEKTYGLTSNQGEKEDRLKLGVTQAGDHVVADDMVQTFNWWVKGSGTYFDGEGHSYKGTQFDIVSGIDYRVNKHVIAGLLFGFGRTDFDTNNSGIKGKFDANGYSVGPYLGLHLSDHLFAEALLVYTLSEYDSSSGSTKGDFNADRITGVVNLRGRFEVGGGSIIEPGIGFLYAHEKQEAFTDSGGTPHASFTVKAGRITAGPKLTVATYKFDGASFSPWVALKGEYDFSNQEREASSSLPDLSDFFSLRAQFGVDSVFENGSKLSLKGDVSGLLSDRYIGIGGQIRYDMPF